MHSQYKYKGDNRYLSFHKCLRRSNQNKINCIIESALSRADNKSMKWRIIQIFEFRPCLRLPVLTDIVYLIFPKSSSAITLKIIYIPECLRFLNYLTLKFLRFYYGNNRNTILTNRPANTIFAVLYILSCTLLAFYKIDVLLASSYNLVCLLNLSRFSTAIN